MDKLQANITTVATCLCLDGKKAWRWYRDSLSGFLDEEEKKKSHENDLEIKEKGQVREVRVPILKHENFGINMAIDEKKIGEEMHTVISNRDTGKIAVLARTLKASDLSELLSKFNQQGFLVKSITRDLSNTYDWFSRQAFMNAEHIADKFHIIKHLLDSMQAVRIRYRQDLLRDRRLKFEAHKKKENNRRIMCKNNGQDYKKKKFNYKPKKAINGETWLEILARTRFILFKYPSDWTISQKERAEILFDKFPEIEKAYKLSISFRNWYKKKNVGNNMEAIIKNLFNWYKVVDETDIDEMNNFKSLVERHQAVIVNYFKQGFTNAIAEGINSKIQRFININQGTRDREFFYFRMNNYFS